MTTKDRAKKAAIATGRGLVTVLAAVGEASAYNAEQARIERETQRHIDEIKALKPDYEIMLVRKA